MPDLPALDKLQEGGDHDDLPEIFPLHLVHRVRKCAGSGEDFPLRLDTCVVLELDPGPVLVIGQQPIHPVHGHEDPPEAAHEGAELEREETVDHDRHEPRRERRVVLLLGSLWLGTSISGESVGDGRAHSKAQAEQSEAAEDGGRHSEQPPLQGSAGSTADPGKVGHDPERNGSGEKEEGTHGEEVVVGRDEG